MNDQHEPEQKPPEQKPNQPAAKKPRPTAGELYQAWQVGGKEKLMEMLPDDEDEDEAKAGGATVSVIKGDKLSRYRESILWVQQRLDGLTLAEPCRRSYLSGACLHTSIEHGFAILVLVDEDLYGSALALIRLQFEAYVRGMWLAQCASDSEVDKVGQDEFPTINKMIASLEEPGRLDGALLSMIKGEAWKPLNSLTHTGYQQIGPRLNKDGIGSYFDADQIRLALNWAEALTILCAIAYAGLAKDDRLALAALERIRSVAASNG